MPRKVTSQTEVRSERAGFLNRLRLLGADRELVSEYDDAWDDLADRDRLTRASDATLRALIRESASFGPAVLVADSDSAVADTERLSPDPASVPDVGTAPGDNPGEDIRADVTSAAESPVADEVGPGAGDPVPVAESDEEGVPGDDLEGHWAAAGLDEHNTVPLVTEWVGDDLPRAGFAWAVEQTREDGPRKGVADHVAALGVDTTAG